MKRILVVGRGKVGTALTRAARASGLDVAWRAGKSSTLGARLSPAVDLVIIAVADPHVLGVAQALAEMVPAPPVAVHCAGALGPKALAPLARRGTAVGAAHPLLSFAGAGGDSLRGGAVVIEGPPRVVRAMCALARRLAMKPVVVDALDRDLYHAAVALAANGTAALAATAERLLARAGVPSQLGGDLLGALLSSVAGNVRALGPRNALSGPVRRGDAATIARHFEALDSADVLAASLYRVLVQAQIPLARELQRTDGDRPVKEAGLRAIEARVRKDAGKAHLLEKPSVPSPRSRRNPRRGAA